MYIARKCYNQDLNPEGLTPEFTIPTLQLVGRKEEGKCNGG
jgi:hypothetical protein